MRFILISLLIAIIVASVLFYFRDRTFDNFSDELKAILMKGDDMGLTLVRSEANIHFVYISKPKIMGKFKLQAEGAKYICFKYNYNKLKNCEVYVWEKKEDVAKKLPIIRTNIPIGYYHIQDEKIVRKKILGI
jgi:hypothetical protein